MTTSPKLLLLIPATALAIAGCGGNDDNDNKDKVKASPPPTTKTTQSSTAGAGQRLSLSADPSGALKFDKTSLTAKAGKVTLVMKNPGSAGVPHAVAVEGKGVDKDGNTVQPGGTSTVSVSLKPGKYEFYCPVDGHKAAGMKGELTVR